MSELFDLQTKFARLVGELITWIYTHPGWEVTGGDWNRPDGRGHMPGSVHYQRLALDLNLFIDGDYKNGDCPEWEEIGKYWLSLDPGCAWGGTFEQKDYNHVSMKYQGRA